MSPLLQNLVVTAIVSICAVHALWTLLPQAVRRVVANRALGLPLPQRLVAALRRTTQAVRGCGCDGCDRVVPKPPDALGKVQRVVLVSRRLR